MGDTKIYSEAYAALLALGEDYVKMVPEDVLEYMKGKVDENLMPAIDQNKAMNEQGLSKDALAIMAMLKLNYMCRTDEEKQKLLSFLQTNEDELKETLMATRSTRELLRLIKDN